MALGFCRPWLSGRLDVTPISVVAPPADHELKAAEEVARISQGDRDAEAAPAADP